MRILNNNPLDSAPWFQFRRDEDSDHLVGLSLGVRFLDDDPLIPQPEAMTNEQKRQFYYKLRHPNGGGSTDPL